MRKLDYASDVRVEVVTTTFVASGVPDGVHDLGRLLENLNNPTMSRQIELHHPAVRPLYRATAQLPLDAPLLVRRDQIIFAHFEGPHYTRGTVRAERVHAPVLLLAPPFQIQGMIARPTGTEAGGSLRMLMQSFFVVSDAHVYDADGNALGEGEQIIVNGAAMQMTCATSAHIGAAAAMPPSAHRAAAAIDRSESDDEAAPARAA